MTEYRLHFGNVGKIFTSECSFTEIDSFFDDDNITSIKVEYNTKTGLWHELLFMKSNVLLNYESTIKNLNEEIANLNKEISFLKTKEKHYENASCLFD